MSSRARLRLAGLSRAFGAVRAVDDVSLEIAPGEIHGLCGQNGAGKSTLVNMLAGIVAPDAGEIRIDEEPVVLRSPRDAQRAGVARVDQELSLAPTLTVTENIVLGTVGGGVMRHRRREAQRARELMHRLGLHDVDPAQPVANLSLGRRQLVEIARALGRDARIVILDEPTATLTDVEIEAVFAAVRGVAEHGAAVIFVSHRLGEVLSLCDRVTVMRDGRTVLAAAPAADLSAATLVEAMLGEQLQPAPAAVAGPTTGGLTLKVENLSIPSRLSGLSHEFSAGHIYGLAGQVGAGASETIHALAGLTRWVGGTASLNGAPLRLGDPTAVARAGVAFVTGERNADGLFFARTVGENLTATQLERLARAGRLPAGALRQRAGELAGAAGVPEERLGDPVGVLSGGNQQKVLVGRYLLRDDVRVLLLDEPTRGVDVAGRAAIHELLRAMARSGKIIIFASSELEEVLELANTTLTMRAGRLIGTYPAGVSGRELLADLTHRTREAA
jgi:ABC-type sugar transport system ATPase subunit